ncbi:MAG: hypothetical protein K8L99_33355 [Anaerolineae bacterium]|nr:hypothetical protein [Anaerolineae bacterium]
MMSQFIEIRIKGHMDKTWEWLGDLIITHSDKGETLLTGSLPDQAALHGVLNRLRDLGVQLISVNSIDQPDPSKKDDVGPLSQKGNSE